MIKSHDRSGWIGASDTAMVMGNWKTKTFEKWWRVKLGITQDGFSSRAMAAGTNYEHKILDAIGVKKRDRQIKVWRLRLRVNLDGEIPERIKEVKTHGFERFKVSKAYWQQAQVEMYATGRKMRRRKDLDIVAYRMEEDDYDNFFREIDPNRLSEHPIPYDKDWIEQEYLPRLRYLARCLRKKVWPCEIPN